MKIKADFVELLIGEYDFIPIVGPSVVSEGGIPEDYY